MFKIFYKFTIIQLSLLMLSMAPAFTEKIEAVNASLNIQDNKQICDVINKNIREGANIGKIVKTAIQMGYNACLIIKCSIEGGGNLEQVLTGAVEAGVTPDVVSRCAVDAGAKAKEIAVILNNVSLPGICYMLPENTEISYPLHPPNPPVMSPSKF